MLRSDIQSVNLATLHSVLKSSFSPGELNVHMELSSNDVTRHSGLVTSFFVLTLACKLTLTRLLSTVVPIHNVCVIYFKLNYATVMTRLYLFIYL